MLQIRSVNTLLLSGFKTNTMMTINKLNISIGKTLTICCFIFLSACKNMTKDSNENKAIENFVSIQKNDSIDKLDVYIGGKFFTSYLHSDSILRKPVLFPIHTANEIRITRGFPFATNPGERLDHPHHYGLWFNHGVVNGIDFWNSAVIPKDINARYGRINHVKFINVESGDIGTIEVEKEWKSDTDELILTEQTTYLFSGDENERIITHITTITAPNVDVLFTDTKEGMFAMRVRRELEIASDKPAVLFDDDLVATESAILDNSLVSGQYKNSNDVEGYPEVWGKRAKWMQLAGKVREDSISISIFDHKDNLNHPPHWMVRDYGLYGVNHFGSNIYTEGKEQFNFTLKKGESATFKHQVVITNGDSSTSKSINNKYENFISKF